MQIKSFLKKFPFTIYSLIAVTTAIVFVLIGEEQRDDLSLIDPVFWIFILNFPLFFFGKFYDLFSIKFSLPWAIIPCFMADLILFHLIPKLIVRIKKVKK